MIVYYIKPIRILSSLLLILSAASISIFAQDFKAVHYGVEYAEVAKEFSGKVVKMNLLRIDHMKVRLDVVHAMDAAIGLEKTSSIAIRHGALAAINAGFFRLDGSIFAGDAAGALRIDGRNYSEPYANRVALFIIDNQENSLFKDPTILINHLTFNHKIRIGKQEIALSGMNRERGENEIILYTPDFHRSTLTGTNGIEIIIENRRIRKILDGRGGNVIPQEGYVISATGAARENLLKIAKIGSKAILPGNEGHMSPGDSLSYLMADDVVAGVPQLIKNGKIDITWEQEKSSKSFVETRHPRTAVAKLKDGKFLMITVDGRSELSGGIGMQDLAEYLLSLGAVDAMNLDGGGSTTMFLDGKVVNKPSDKEGERKVSDALIVTPRR